MKLQTMKTGNVLEEWLVHWANTTPQETARKRLPNHQNRTELNYEKVTVVMNVSPVIRIGKLDYTSKSASTQFHHFACHLEQISQRIEGKSTDNNRKVTSMQ